jgi:hypothetical protein
MFHGADVIAWTQRLALTGWARIAEPTRLRLRVFGVAARLIRTGRRYLPKISAAWPWSKQITSARTRSPTSTCTTNPARRPKDLQRRRHSAAENRSPPLDSAPGIMISRQPDQRSTIHDHADRS